LERGNVFIREWRDKVYGMKDKELPPENWDKIRAAVLLRDHMTCLRCEKQFKLERFLSVHHMIPRAEGGSHGLFNLVTLCHPCHDYVELMELRNKAAIIGSWEGEPREVKYKPKEKVSSYVDTFERPTWHAHVYGGKRGPR
jgi:hypothetical protein